MGGEQWRSEVVDEKDDSDTASVPATPPLQRPLEARATQPVAALPPAVVSAHEAEGPVVELRAGALLGEKLVVTRQNSVVRSARPAPAASEVSGRFSWVFAAPSQQPDE
jgi:hypothetical protein